MQQFWRLNVTVQARNSKKHFRRCAVNSLAKSLRCLIHPLTLVSLILLLVNDHVLKIVTPSWLTGKLSDFAGLFFFPFLLAALLAFVLREKLNTRQVGIIAFGITTVWFVLMKTTTWGNAFTENFASFVLQTRAQIAQDPTDVIAMSVMVPGWALWEKTKTTRPPKWAWLVLFVAAFASMATSCPPPPPTLSGVFVSAGLVYVTQNYSSTVFASRDGGTTWDQVSNLDAESGEATKTIVYAGQKICRQEYKNQCYRIADSKRKIEYSDDNGATWRTEWEVPTNRLLFAERMRGLEKGTSNRGLVINMCSTDDKMDVALQSIAILEREDIYRVIVVYGEQGALARTENGIWLPYTVSSFKPYPTFAQNWNQAVEGTTTETAVWFFCVIVGGLVLLAAGLLPKSTLWIFASILAVIFGFVIWLLWAFGLIPEYGVTWLLVLVVTGGVLILGWRKKKLSVRQ